MTAMSFMTRSDTDGGTVLTDTNSQGNSHHAGLSIITRANQVRPEERNKMP
jgi:hypothetical protein